MSYIGNTKIGKMYLGDTEIAKAYLGDDLVFQQGSQPQPVMIPYIRGGADGSYIDTGITPDNTTKVIVWARNFNPNGGILFGSRVASGNNAFYLAANTGVNSCRMSINFGTDIKYATAGTDEMYFSHYHKYEIDGTNLYVDNTLLATSTGSFSGNNLTIHILGANTNGTHTTKTSPTDICACKIYKGGVLVRDYTPFSSPSVGLYDAVSDTVFTNAGSGTLVYGEFDENAYTPLEYIECTEAQYFNTGIYGSESLPFVIKYAPTGSKAWPNIMGARTSNSSKRYGLAFGTNVTPYIDAYFEYNTGAQVITSTNSMVSYAHVFVKNNNSFSAYRIQSSGLVSVGTTTATAATFTTDYTIDIGGVNIAGSHGNQGAGKIHYAGFGSSANFVPAKKGGKVGMYDTYNDVFKESESSTPFVAGPEL